MCILCENAKLYPQYSEMPFYLHGGFSLQRREKALSLAVLATAKAENESRIYSSSVMACGGYAVRRREAA